MQLHVVCDNYATHKHPRRGSFHNVDDLEATIRAYIDGYNERASPFIWTKTAGVASNTSLRCVRASVKVLQSATSGISTFLRRWIRSCERTHAARGLSQ